jgi:hypothetical protein
MERSSHLRSILFFCRPIFASLRSATLALSRFGQMFMPDSQNADWEKNIITTNANHFIYTVLTHWQAHK